MCWQDVRDVVLPLAAGFAAGKLTHSRAKESGYGAYPRIRLPFISNELMLNSCVGNKHDTGWFPSIAARISVTTRKEVNNVVAIPIEGKGCVEVNTDFSC